MGFDPEAEALAVFEEAGIDPAQSRDVWPVIKAYFGADNLEPRAALPVLAAYDAENDRLLYRRHAAPVRFRYAASHEAGERRLWVIGYQEPDVEDMASRIGVRLWVPTQALRNYTRQMSDANSQIGRLAGMFGTSETVIVRRLGEVLDRPTLVVDLRDAARRFMPAGPEWVWGPDAEAILSLARTNSPPRWLERWRLRDSPGRVALTVR